MYLPSCFLLSLILFMFFTDVVVWTVSNATLTPKDPAFYVGDTIVLNCTFTSHFNATENSSLLAFRHNGMVYGSEFVLRLTPQTAQLRIPNATLDHYGHFACFLLPNQSLGLHAMQYVSIIRRPLKPKITQCQVLNWESLNCSWVPTREEQRKHSLRNLLYTTAVWHDARFESEVCQRNVSEDFFVLTQNANATFNSCGFHMGHSYALQIKVAIRTSDRSKPVISDSFSIHTSDVVRPNPPENVTYSFNSNGTTMSLIWNPPTSKYHYDQQQLTYAVSIRSKWDQAAKSDELLNETSITLPYNPYTNYTVILKVRPLPLGYWSSETSLHFQTPSTVPCQQPDLNPGGFAFTSLTSLERIVTLYWRPVPEYKHCGPDFHYVVSTKSSEDWSILNATILDSRTEIPIGPNQTHFRVLAKNRQGVASGRQNVVKVPSLADFPGVFPVGEVVVEVDTRNASYALIRWDYLTENKNVTKIVIFWCTSSTMLPDVVKCTNSIEWEELDKTQRQFSVSSGSDVNLLRVGISVDLLGISCGIKWSTTMYALDKVAPAPEMFNVIFPYDSDLGHVYVSWKKPECHEGLCGHVDEYILIYCIVGESGGCAESSRRVSFASTQFSYDLKGLSYGSKYQLWMLSVSVAGLSKSSVMVTVEIARPWKTTGAIVGIAIGALVTAMVVIFGLYSIFRCCCKFEKKITGGVEIVLPRKAAVSKVMRTGSSSDTRILYSCYPNGYSRQGSDMSTLSRDSGHFSLTNPCSTSNIMILQQMSPLMSKPSGSLISTIIPLIGIEEDGATNDAFPAVQEPDENNYVKTIVIEDPNDDSGYKVIHTVDAYGVNDNFSNPGQHTQNVQLAKQPEVWISSSLQSRAPRPETPAVLRATADADSCAYIRIAPGTNLNDGDAFYKGSQAAPEPAVSIPTLETDVIYATVEMLNTNSSISVGTVAGNTVENGYTDLTFVTSNILGKRSRDEQQLPQTEGKFHHQVHPETTVPSEDSVTGDLSQSLSEPFRSKGFCTNSDLNNGNNNSEFKLLIDPITNCLEVASSNQNHLHPVLSSTQPDLSLPAKELEKENCSEAIPNSIPARCDNGYILHADLIGSVINM